MAYIIEFIVEGNQTEKELRSHFFRSHIEERLVVENCAEGTAPIPTPTSHFLIFLVLLVFGLFLESSAFRGICLIVREV